MASPLTSCSVAAAVVFVLAFIELAAAAVAADAPPPPPEHDDKHCRRTCGDVGVPYPFGIGPGADCHHSAGFNLTCEYTSHGAPRLLLGDGTLQVDRIFTENSTVRVHRTAGDIKIVRSSDDGGDGRLGGGLKEDGPYRLSVANELIMTGCNALVTLTTGGSDLKSVCATFCSVADGHADMLSVRRDADLEPMCAGMGCCRAPIFIDSFSTHANGGPYDVHFKWLSAGGNHSQEKALRPVRVFVAEEGWLPPNGAPPKRGPTPAVPLILDWEVDVGGWRSAGAANFSAGGSCPQETRRRICRSKNSECDVGQRGYRCRCEAGYAGNPYTTGGCQGMHCQLT
jgi:hypothetical protein